MYQGHNFSVKIKHVILPRMIALLLGKSTVIFIAYEFHLLSHFQEDQKILLSILKVHPLFCWVFFLRFNQNYKRTKNPKNSQLGART